VLFPQPDTLTFEVFLGEGGMPQSVLLLGQPKAVKALLRDDSALGGERRLADYAKVMQVRCLQCNLFTLQAPLSPRYLSRHLN
jgi:hypothetical protein